MDRQNLSNNTKNELIAIAEEYRSRILQLSNCNEELENQIIKLKDKNQQVDLIKEQTAEISDLKNQAEKQTRIIEMLALDVTKLKSTIVHQAMNLALGDNNKCQS